MPFKLPPLFARSKTAYSSTSSEHESAATTAASSTFLANSSFTDLRKSSSIFHKRRGRSKASSHRVADDHSRSPPTTAPAAFGADSTLLGSVGEEKDELDGSNNDAAINTFAPTLILQEATPPATDTELPIRHILPRSPLGPTSSSRPRSADGLSLQSSVAGRSSNASPKHVSRRPSVVDSANATVIQQRPKMPRKIWVKRPGASATLVQVREDDLVDDVREMILRKYANSLGRTFDAPDMTLKIVARSELAVGRLERTLGPEEEICHAIDAAYSGGQTVEEALVIDVPVRRTPKPSPRAFQHQGYHAMDDYRPAESGTDYFQHMPVLQPMLPGTTANNQHHPSIAQQDQYRSMAVLTTGQLPPIPSPGSSRKYREHRPKIGRTHTSSPTIVQHSSIAGMPLSSIPANMVLHRASNRPRVESSASDTHQSMNGILPQPSNLPTPPIPEAPPLGPLVKGPGSTPPTPSTAMSMSKGSVRPRKIRKPTPDKLLSRPRKDRRGSHDSPAQMTLPGISNMLEGVVPPINVLLVEDNIINLKVLQTLMKRLKVRWESAMNGKIAVDKWRKGGYHLILMDIQMPVMNGLQATKEIRRLEKVNGIGVFSSSAPSSPEETRARRKEYMDGADADIEAGDTNSTEVVQRDTTADRLTISESTFKSPIIIVALTASSLQSDRHEALAAGCNDFLTKPVHLPWLERKVKEWGCMQALIDFDGWKRWRDINEKEEAGKSEGQKAREREQDGEQKKRSDKQAAVKKASDSKKAEEESRKKAVHRVSMEGSTTNGLVNGH